MFRFIRWLYSKWQDRELRLNVKYQTAIDWFEEKFNRPYTGDFDDAADLYEMCANNQNLKELCDTRINDPDRAF